MTPRPTVTPQVPQAVQACHELLILTGKGGGLSESELKDILEFSE